MTLYDATGLIHPVGTGTATMHVHVNGKLREVPTGCTVADVLRVLGLEPVRVAVEVNEEMVRRARYQDAVLREGDQVEIVTFVGGG